jgi:hypothetical protein
MRAIVHLFDDPTSGELNYESFEAAGNGLAA